jgi:DUF1680 family protein
MITPVPFTEVALADSFWLPRIETNRKVTIPFIFKQCEETGRIDNFAIAGGLMKGEYKGERYNDTDVYKTIEGAAYSLMVHPDPALDAYLDGVIAKIAAAQEKDGYLYTPRTASPNKLQPGIGTARWEELAISHELYNAGHLIEAAVAHFQATGKRTLFDVAVKFADLIAATFGPDKKHGFPGHQEIELALVKLYRVTGKDSYLALAKYFLDQRGNGLTLKQYPPGNRFAIYNDAEQIQAHRPVLEQAEAVGHAVRVTYMLSGLTDVAAMTGLPAYRGAALRLWDNVVGRKMYLTGGIGSRHDRERFGPDYELPNLTGYLETCASIGMVFWNHRMLLLTGEAKYADVMERVMYNGVVAGVSLDGMSFFYPNPLESDGIFRFNKGRAERAPWFGTACCPGNISRFLPSVPGYVYATRDDAVYINLFIAGTARIALKDQTVVLRQETRYPWDGMVKIIVDSDPAGPFEMRIRVPGWAQGRPVPTDLYRYLDDGAGNAAGTFELKVNGRAHPIDLEKGFAVVRRTWEKGDAVEIIFPMPVRRVIVHPAVKDDEGLTALERGPLVYCVEGADNGGKALGIVLPDDARIEAEFKPAFFNGIVVLKAAAQRGTVESPENGSVRVREEAADDEDDVPPARQRKLIPGIPLEPHELVAIPYYAWAHRGPGEMAVWLFRK